jgi:hypothetical protein
VAYEPLQFASNIKIFRPGSFNRVTREDASMRQPVMLHIRVNGDKLQHKVVPIETARDFNEIFHAKHAVITKAQQSETYESIISQIKDAKSQNMSFKEALQTVTTETVVNYVFKTVALSRQESITKNKNL